MQRKTFDKTAPGLFWLHYVSHFFLLPLPRIPWRRSLQRTTCLDFPRPSSGDIHHQSCFLRPDFEPAGCSLHPAEILWWCCCKGLPPCPTFQTASIRATPMTFWPSGLPPSRWELREPKTWPKFCPEDVRVTLGRSGRPCMSSPKTGPEFWLRLQALQEL